MLNYMSVAEIAAQASRQGLSIGRLVLQDQAAQMERSEADILNEMDEDLHVMERAAERGLQPGLRSNSGLTGGDGARMRAYAAHALSGPFCARAMQIALGTAECNAAMGRIVASPTAGSCGILPGAVISMMENCGVGREDACLALIAAGGIGMVIANQASISGAAGGCQAECGSAAAMAAAALVQMAGGNPEMMENAVTMALKNLLGLVCDPVAGLVEVPCIKRNAGGIMIAIAAADMALAGIRSVIPVDEVISAMREVGESLPCALRETALGGLAVTPTGQEIKSRIFSK